MQISLSRTKIVEMIHACAVWETLLALRFAISFKAKKEPPKIFSKRKIAERAIHTESKQSQTKSKKYLTIYSINIGLYYSTKNIIVTSQQFKQIHKANYFTIKLYLT